MGNFGEIFNLAINNFPKVAKCKIVNLNIMYICVHVMLIVQIAKFKSHQYQMRITSPNFMLTKIIHYTVHKNNNQITTKLIFVAVSSESLCMRRQ